MRQSKPKQCRGKTEEHQCGLQLVVERDCSSSSLLGLVAIGEGQAAAGGLDHMRLPFAYKLHILLCDAERNGCEDIISWVEHGNAFKIHDQRRFKEVIQPLYFRQSKITSFIRQCYMYGFSKIESGPGLGSYFHPSFQRDDQRKSLMIQRHSPTWKNRNNYHHHAPSTRIVNKESPSTTTTILLPVPPPHSQENNVLASIAAGPPQPIRRSEDHQTPTILSPVIDISNHNFCNVDDLLCPRSSRNSTMRVAACSDLLGCGKPNMDTICLNEPLVVAPTTSLLWSSPRSVHHQEGQEAEDETTKFIVGHDDDDDETSSYEPRPIELMLEEKVALAAGSYYKPWRQPSN